MDAKGERVSGGGGRVWALHQLHARIFITHNHIIRPDEDTRGWNYFLYIQPDIVENLG